MQERFWAMYVSIKYKEFYYLRYSIRSQRINGFVTGVCALFSVSSITAWTIWNYIPFAWAFTVVLAQVVQVVQVVSTRFPYSNQIISLKFLLPELALLLCKIDDTWRRIDNYSDDQINDFISSYNEQFNCLVSKFIGNTHFPVSKRCIKSANERLTNYFGHFYNVTCEEDLNA